MFPPETERYDVIVFDGHLDPCWIGKHPMWLHCSVEGLERLAGRMHKQLSFRDCNPLILELEAGDLEISW